MRAAPFIHRILVLAVAAVLAWWSFLTFPDSEALNHDEWVGLEQLTLGREVEFTETLTVIRNGRDQVTVLPNSVATLTWDEEKETVNVELSRGGVYFSSLARDFTVSVETPFARVNSQDSSAYVVLNEEGTDLEVYAIEHPSLLTFVLEGEDLNALLVPTDYKLKVASSKVSSTLARLRLTKLTKEFQIFVFEEAPEEVQTLIEASEIVYQDSEFETLEYLQKQSHLGPSFTGWKSHLHGAYKTFQEILTLLPSAEDSLILENKEAYLNYALSNLLFGNPATGEYWLQEWEALSPDPLVLKELHSRFFFVLPGDELYPVKESVAEQLFPHEEALVSLRREFQDIESLIQVGSMVDAESAYLHYRDHFNAVLQKGSFDEMDDLSAISREYFLLELLLRNHSVFYNVEATGLLTSLEEKIMALAGSTQDLDEERQTFIQSKIRFLTNLIDFVESRKVSVKDASDLAEELISEAETYLNTLTSEVAVSSYFESKLEEFNLALQFMNSAEFYSYSSFEEGLEAYRLKVEDLEALNDYLQELRSGEDTETMLSLEQAVEEVESDLKAASIQVSSVQSLEDPSYRLFSLVNARTGGYEFEANYDRETQILYDVVVGDLRFSAGLSLENARIVIERASVGTGPEIEDENPEETTSSSSLTDSVALRSAEAAFGDAGLDPDDFTLTVVDLSSNLFSFAGEISDLNVMVSGSFALKTGQVSEGLYTYNGETQALTDGSLDGLYARLQLAVENL